MMNKKLGYILCLIYAINAWSCGSSESDESSEGCNDMTAECLFDRPAVQTDHYQLKLIALSPNPPERGENTWRIQIHAQATQEPLEGCGIDLIPFMPEHGHGSPKTPELSELGGGEYEFSDIVFTMPGLWSMEFSMTCADLAAEQALIDFTL